MKRSTITALALATVLALSACSDKANSGGQPDPDTTPEPAGTLHFVLKETYTVGQRARVVLANDTETTYIFNDTGYEACNLTYTEQTGREFIIPPGTHCDLITMVDLPPGERTTLFLWNLNECTKDDWGCIKYRDLDPGTYTIAGSFEQKEGGERTPVEATFAIVEG